MTSLEAFKALISKFDLPISNKIEVGPTDYLDVVDPDRGTFVGADKHGRAFVHIAITAYRVVNGGDPTVCGVRRAFTVFQRYVDSENIFVVGRNPFPMTRDNFILTPAGEHDFSKLEKLLSGETLRFHDTKWTGNNFSEDPKNYIELTITR